LPVEPGDQVPLFESEHWVCRGQGLACPGATVKPFWADERGLGGRRGRAGWGTCRVGLGDPAGAAEKHRVTRW
jgi:hypothetical protein